MKNVSSNGHKGDCQMLASGKVQNIPRLHNTRDSWSLLIKHLSYDLEDCMTILHRHHCFYVIHLYSSLYLLNKRLGCLRTTFQYNGQNWANKCCANVVVTPLPTLETDIETTFGQPSGNICECVATLPPNDGDWHWDYVQATLCEPCGNITL